MSKQTIPSIHSVSCCGAGWRRRDSDSTRPEVVELFAKNDAIKNNVYDQYVYLSIQPEAEKN